MEIAVRSCFYACEIGAELILAEYFSDPRPWRKLGELTTTVFALGLHQEPSYQLPLYLAELRKRTMVATFSIDKILATFLGRPPLVSWRYCEIQFPLDLSFEEMLLEPSLVQEKVLCLEKNGGWNDEGTIRKGAWARVSLFKSILREKVLELSLSYRVEDIRSKAECVLLFSCIPIPLPLSSR